MEGFFEHGDEP